MTSLCKLHALIFFCKENNIQVVYMDTRLSVNSVLKDHMKKESRNQQANLLQLDEQRQEAVK